MRWLHKARWSTGDLCNFRPQRVNLCEQRFVFRFLLYFSTLCRPFRAPKISDALNHELNMIRRSDQSQRGAKKLPQHRGVRVSPRLVDELDAEAQDTKAVDMVVQ